MSEKVPYKKALEMLYEKNAEIDDLRARLEQMEKQKEDAIKEVLSLAKRLRQSEGEKTSNTAAWIKIPEANLRVIEAENADLRERACCIPTNGWGHTDDCLRTRLAEYEKMYNASLSLFTDVQRERDRAVKFAAENAALKEKLEEIKQWRKNCGDTLTKGDFIFLPSFHFGLLDEILDGE